MTTTSLESSEGQIEPDMNILQCKYFHKTNPISMTIPPQYPILESIESIKGMKDYITSHSVTEWEVQLLSAQQAWRLSEGEEKIM